MSEHHGGRAPTGPPTRAAQARALAKALVLVSVQHPAWTRHDLLKQLALVMPPETRHMSPEEARELLLGLAEEALSGRTGEVVYLVSVELYSGRQSRGLAFAVQATPRRLRRPDMPKSQWHRFYTRKVAAPPALLFGLLSDMPNYGRWLPPSKQFDGTTDVEPYPVQLGSRYHDGRPDQQGKNWWGSVTGFQPPGSIDFHHTIRVRQLRATVDVHIHYSFEPEQAGTVVSRWLVLDFSMPVIFRPLRPAITANFDKENLRTMAAVAQYAEAHAGDGVTVTPADQLPRAASSPS